MRHPSYIIETKEAPVDQLVVTEDRLVDLAGARTEQFLTTRADGPLRNHAFFLSPDYEWFIVCDRGHTVLVPLEIRR